MQERLQWYKNTIEACLFFCVFYLAERSYKQTERKLSSTAVQAQATPQGNPNCPVRLH